MCAIAGLYGPFEHPVSEMLGSTLAHRGPDECGSYVSKNKKLQMFHQRLSIIDLSPTGTQPMVSSDGRLTMVYNGEVYNFLALRKELQNLGFSFIGNSDTEVVLAAYRAWGISFLRRLNGVFALAISDEKNDTLLIARDAMGVKPLYYSAVNNKFSFCSEIKGLMSMLPELSDIDYDALRNYLSFIYCPGPGTPLKSVKKLEPGTALKICSGKIVKKWSFYKSPFLRARKQSMPLSVAVDETKRLLKQAVKRQMVSDVPLGAFLSGGVDSSAIVSFAQENISNLECFTINPLSNAGADEFEDLGYAKAAAAHLGVKLNVVDVDPKQFASDIEKMIWQLDEPIADPASLNTLYISQVARKSGIKVLLSGTGGDDIFSGYRRHQALNISQKLMCLPLLIRLQIIKLLSIFPTWGSATRKKHKLVQILTQADEYGITAYFLWCMADEVNSLFKEQGSAPIGFDLHAYIGTADQESSPLQKMLSLEQRFFLADHNLNYTDKMGMAAGVEIRVPFLDLDLVEFASRVPDKYRLCGSKSKWLLKESLRDRLPGQILDRSKTGFSVPIRKWMRNELKTYVADTLSPDSIKRRGIFDAGSVQKLLEDNDSGRRDVAFTLLSILSIEIWCQKFLDAK